MTRRDLIRVLVIDDSAYSRQNITRMLGTSPLVEVVGVARDGEGLASRLLDQARGLPRRALVEIADHDPGAHPREQHRRRAPDPHARARDQRGPAPQPLTHQILSKFRISSQSVTT